jgi:hypothetical protein
MAGNEPYSTIEELPDFDIEFPEGSFDPDPEEEEDDLDALPYEDDDRDWSDQDNFPYHELDDIVDHPINWLG